MSRIAKLEAVLRKLVHEWDSWSAGDEPLGDDRLEALVEEARTALGAATAESNLREIAQRLAAHAKRRVVNFEEIRDMAAALHRIANDLLLIDAHLEPPA